MTYVHHDSNQSRVQITEIHNEQHLNPHMREPRQVRERDQHHRSHMMQQHLVKVILGNTQKVGDSVL